MSATCSKGSKYERDRKLALLGRESYVSKSGIEKLLKGVQRDGLPDTFDRSAQHRARKNLCATETDYGKLVSEVVLVAEDGSEIKQGFQNPLAMLQYHCEHSPHYAEIVRTALDVSPCAPSSPWGIILYQDGVDPSDGLAKNHSRKKCGVLLIKRTNFKVSSFFEGSISDRVADVRLT